MTDIVLPSGTRLGMATEGALRFLFQGAHLASPSPRQESKEVPPDRPVRVLAVVHGWMPALAAGSERMMQHLLDALPKGEFEVTVLSAGTAAPENTPLRYEYEGTPVQVGYYPDFVPDLIITHHGPSARVVSGLLEEFPGTPIVAVFHNERLDIPDILALEADLNVFNTNWVKKAIGSNGIVVRPPLEYDRHHVDKTGDAVTLINLQENKGVNTFLAVMGRMPDTEFLGVQGTHGTQAKIKSPNYIHQPVTQDMREVWSRTKVLLAPSEYESFGMVAAEACASGIPVIAHPTPGLVECLGFAGIFVDRGDTDTYERTLRLLLTDDQAYAERSAMATERGRQLVSQSRKELSKFVNAVRKVVRP